MDGLVCMAVRGEREREGKKGRERARMCGFSVKTDRLLMHFSTDSQI